MSLIDPNHPTHRVRRALGLKTILGSDYPGEPFPDLPEELRPFLPETSRIGIYPSELQSGPESSSRNEAPHGAPETERVDELKRRFLKPFGDDPRNMGGSLRTLGGAKPAFGVVAHLAAHSLRTTLPCPPTQKRAAAMLRPSQ